MVYEFTSAANRSFFNGSCPFPIFRTRYANVTTSLVVVVIHRLLNFEQLSRTTKTGKVHAAVWDAGIGWWSCLNRYLSQGFDILLRAMCTCFPVTCCRLFLSWGKVLNSEVTSICHRTCPKSHVELRPCGNSCPKC